MYFVLIGRDCFLKTNKGKLFRRILLSVCSCLSIVHPARSIVSLQDEVAHGWGVAAITLGSEPVILNEFYRMGGEKIAATPTTCEVSYRSDTLYVSFRCIEPNLDHPATYHGVDWHTNITDSPNEQNGSFPDKIDFFLRPDINATPYFQFVATKDGKSFGSKYDPHADVRFEKVAGFEADITEEAGAWLVNMKIPWVVIGGKPAERFGLAPLRTRWRNSEVSSPMTIDFTDRPIPDNYIEVSLDEPSDIYYADGPLYQLPSGKLHWQRSTALQYPTRVDLARIWALQQ